MDKYEVTVTFTEPLLGTVPLNRETYADYVADEAPDEDAADEELDTVPEDVEDKGLTGFHCKDERPILYDYVIKGFLKDACSMLRRAKGTKSSKIRAYKKIIDGLIFPAPRMIELRLPDGEEMDELTRPLRASTAQGERVALAHSQTMPVGTEMTFTLTVLGQVDEATLREWFDYGQLRGFGQWRNAGYGRFTYEIRVLD